MELENNTNEKKSVFKNPFFWISGCLVVFIFLAIIIGSVFFFLRSANTNSQYDQKLKKSWNTIVDASIDVASKAKLVSDEVEIKSFVDDVNDFNDILKNESSNIIDLDVSNDNRNAHDDLLQSLKKVDDYVLNLQTVLSKKPIDLNSNSFNYVNDSAELAEKATKASTRDFEFLDNLDSLFFKVHISFSPIYEDIWAKRDAEQAKQQEDAAKVKADTEKKKQLQNNLSDAKGVVFTYLNAYIGSDANEMKSVLSGEAKAEFDPDLIFQGDAAPKDFTINSGEVTEKENYRYYGDVKFKDYEGIEFVERYKFVVGKIGNDYWIIRRQYVKRISGP